MQDKNFNFSDDENEEMYRDLINTIRKYSQCPKQDSLSFLILSIGALSYVEDEDFLSEYLELFFSCIEGLGAKSIKIGCMNPEEFQKRLLSETLEAAVLNENYELASKVNNILKETV